MGCDGGTIPKRSDLIKEKPKEEKADVKAIDKITWETCYLSKKPLCEPIVGCFLGRLYNKESILEYLLDSQKVGDDSSGCSHITSIKDVRDLKMRSVNGEKGIEYVCPVTMKPMTGTYRFVFLATCGHVFSEAALREIPAIKCITCNKEFTENDVISIFPHEEELEKLFSSLPTRRKKKRKNISTQNAQVNQSEPAKDAIKKMKLEEPLIALTDSIQPTQNNKSKAYASIFVKQSNK